MKQQQEKSSYDEEEERKKLVCFGKGARINKIWIDSNCSSGSSLRTRIYSKLLLNALLFPSRMFPSFALAGRLCSLLILGDLCHARKRSQSHCLCSVVWLWTAHYVSAHYTANWREQSDANGITTHTHTSKGKKACNKRAKNPTEPFSQFSFALSLSN